MQSSAKPVCLALLLATSLVQVALLSCSTLLLLDWLRRRAWSKFTLADKCTQVSVWRGAGDTDSADLPSDCTSGNRSVHAGPSAKVAIVTAAFGTKPRYLDVVFENQQMYAELHGYRSITVVNENVTAKNRGRYKAKLQLVRQLLLESQHEYVMWKDSDTLFIDCSRTLEAVLHEHYSKDVIFTKDVTEWLVNTGVMIFKNTLFSRTFLETVLKTMERMPAPKGPGMLPGEQVYVNFALLDRYSREACRGDMTPCLGECHGDDCLSLVDPHVARHISILPNHALQTQRPYRAIPPPQAIPFQCPCLASDHTGETATVTRNATEIADLGKGRLVARIAAPLSTTVTRPMGINATKWTPQPEEAYIEETPAFIMHVAGAASNASRRRVQLRGQIIFSHATFSSCFAMKRCNQICIAAS
ncbi:unnamed protein product [Vitrella brassicaformis CCMP3155]|uniref:Nucleotide-diphospho-sugar transferase domain-containing protein n=1 Tax=Vitrella brassicaformis (strain CCMP3155) TaxID=1169540 RepID=A0A0G4EVR2_VITBC|nr:unnamed protein product [Vitrella brassicaformis CCMP3155]|mmetsp:Transcript_37380/g.93801  ORF Transcript_37380/g.93801 Transcript_37380/m.93801 type:complete len:416 (-) Transcript_37380:1572-2819(-)|eukprot:CEM02394.1 unnamed protein product [Vitrella brassicaformis CCMP3155]